MPSGIDLVFADHEAVAALFDQFDARPDGTIVGAIVDMLTAHDQAEHAALYPMVARLLDDSEAVERSELAHAAVKRQMTVVTSSEGSPLIAAVAQLRALVQEHVSDEERNILPSLAAAATEQQLDELGARLMQAKQRVG